jgi:hypothetical protein
MGTQRPLGIMIPFGNVSHPVRLLVLNERITNKLQSIYHTISFFHLDIEFFCFFARFGCWQTLKVFIPSLSTLSASLKAYCRVIKFDQPKYYNTSSLEKNSPFLSTETELMDI